MNKAFLLCSLMLLPLSLLAQHSDTIFFDAYWNKTTLKHAVNYYKVTYYLDSLEGKGVRKTYNLSGQILSEDFYSSLKENIPDSTHTSWFDNGKVKSLCHYKEGKFHGELTTYYNNGTLKRKDKYQEGELLEGHCYSENGSEIKHFPYWVLPQYPGGEAKLVKFIRRKIKYPYEAYRQNIEGKVLVTFKVEKDGNINEVNVKEPANPILAREALRVVYLFKKWEPGLLDGEEVITPVTLPIDFKTK